MYSTLIRDVRVHIVTFIMNLEKMAHYEFEILINHGVFNKKWLIVEFSNLIIGSKDFQRTFTEPNLSLGVQWFTGTPVLHGFNLDDTYRDTQNVVMVWYDTSNTSLTTINNKTAYLTPPQQDYCSFKYTSAFVGHRGDHLIENIQV